MLRLTLVGFAALLVGIPAGLMAWVRTPIHNDVGQPREQPIAFDHRHHVRDDGIGCLYCHHDAESSAYAGVPDTQLCMGCHAQIWNDSPATARLRDSWEQREPIRWRRVTDLPDFVFFDHSAHVSRGVGCETCHGRVDLMPLTYQARLIDMGWCLDCHRDPAPHLRPPSDVAEMGYATSREVGRRVAEQYDVSPPTDCTGCHR